MKPEGSSVRISLTAICGYVSGERPTRANIQGHNLKSKASGKKGQQNKARKIHAFIILR